MIWRLLILVLSLNMALGQTNNENKKQGERLRQRIENLATLSPDSIIELAVSRISKPTFNRKDFNRIEAWATDNSFFVKFSHVIQVIPQKGRCYFSVTVDLLNPRISYTELGGAPINDTVEFYKPNTKDQKTIDFVRTAINKSEGKIGSLDDNVLPYGIMTIDEKDSYFEVFVNFESISSSYKIEKATMKIYDERHRHKPLMDDSSIRKIF